MATLVSFPKQNTTVNDGIGLQPLFLASNNFGSDMEQLILYESYNFIVACKGFDVLVSISLIKYNVSKFVVLTTYFADK